MLLNILFLLLSVFYSHAIPWAEMDWTIKYISYTKGAEYDRVINNYYFDQDPYVVGVPYEDCVQFGLLGPIMPLGNTSGYVYCTTADAGIKQLCPPGTKVSFSKGGCVNKTTNALVLPAGSRCASQPCQNDGICFDFSSADSYFCMCRSPYTGLHCHVEQWRCVAPACGDKTSEIIPMCRTFTSDMALNYTCICRIISPSVDRALALDNCHDPNQLFYPKCEGEKPVGAVPFTNKGFYICRSDKFSAFIQPCPLHHVWNDTRKQCVLENI